MRFLCLLLVLSIARSGPAAAQDSAASPVYRGVYDGEHLVVSLAYGFLDRLAHDAGYLKNIPVTVRGPISYRMEVPVSRTLSFGFFAEGVSSRQQVNAVRYSYSSAYGFGFTVGYHLRRFIPAERLDVFGTAGAGFYKETLNNHGHTERPDHAVFRPYATLAARYTVLPKLAAFVEGGYVGYARCCVGLSYRLPV